MKNMVPSAGCYAQSIPLNAALNGRELSEIHAIFGRSVSEHPQSAAQIDGIDRDFLFGNAWQGVLVLGLIHFPFLLGTVQVSEGRALICINYSIVYLGFVTTLGSFGEGLVTLTLG